MQYHGEIVWEETYEGETDSHFYHADGDEVDGLFNLLMGYGEGNTVVMVMIKQNV